MPRRADLSQDHSRARRPAPRPAAVRQHLHPGDRLAGGAGLDGRLGRAAARLCAPGVTETTSMPHHTPLIATLVAGLVLAFVLGALAHRVRASPIVGYLLAGVLVGPYTPGFVADPAMAAELAEIGVILLMFGVGLHFSLHDLLSVRAIAIPGALVQMAAATLLGMALAWGFGWKLGADLVFGLALSVASTVVLLRALQERRLVDTEQGRIAIGWLIVQDLAMVAGVGAVAAGCGPARRYRGGGNDRGYSRDRDRARHHLRQSGRVCRADAAGRAAGHPPGAPLCRSHRLAGAVPPGRALARPGRRVWRDRAVRRLLRARRVLRRHGACRIRAQPPGGRGVAAAPRRLRCPLLRLGRDAVRPDHPGARTGAGDRDLVDHRAVQSSRSSVDRTRLPASVGNRADDRRQFGADRRVLVHRGGTRSGIAPSASGRSRSHS